MVAREKTGHVDTVKTHVLDAIRGYYVADWVLDDDVSRKDVEEFATRTGELYVVIAYEDGEPITLLTKKEVWEKQRSIHDSIDRGEDYQEQLDAHVNDLKRKIDNEIVFCQCPNCASRVRVQRKHLGKKGRCSHCEEIFEATLLRKTPGSFKNPEQQESRAPNWPKEQEEFAERSLFLDKTDKQSHRRLAEAQSGLRGESHKILDEVGDDLRESLLTGRVHMSVDRSYARAFLCDPRADELFRPFGVSLRGPRSFIMAITVFEPLCVLTLVGLVLYIFGWWGLWSVPAIPFLVWLGWPSLEGNSGRFGLSKSLFVLCLGYTIYAITQTIGTSYILFGITATLLPAARIVKYAYPQRRIKRLILECPNLVSVLVDANVVYVGRDDGRMPCEEEGSS